MNLEQTTQLLMVTAFVTAALCGPFPAVLTAAVALLAVSSHFVDFRLPMGTRGELFIWLPGVAVMVWGVFNPFAEGIGNEKSGAALSSAATMLLLYGFFLAVAISWSQIKERLLKQVAVAIGLMVVLGRVPYNDTYAICGLVFGLLIMVLFVLRRRETISKRTGQKGRPLSFWTILHCFGALLAGSLMALSLPGLERYAVEQMVSATSGRKSGFAAVTNLNSVGKMAKSNIIALRIDSQMQPTYMRGMVYNYYRFGRWRSTCSAPIHEGNEAPTSVPNMTLVTSTKTSSAVRRKQSGTCMSDNPTIGIIFVPLSTTKIVGPDLPIKWDSHLGTRIPFALTWSYETGHNPLVKPGATSPMDLLIKRGFSPRMKEMALKLTKGLKSQRERVQKICGYFKSQYTYSLEKERSPRGVDPVEDFVFRTKKGHCELYATATVILLRYLKIPARYVTGFTVTEKNPLTGLWLAREQDAHAWVEVLLPGEGWVIFDPTPGTAESDLAVGRWIDYVVGWFKAMLRSFFAWWEKLDLLSQAKSFVGRLRPYFQRDKYYVGWLLLALLFCGPTLYRKLKALGLRLGWFSKKLKVKESLHQQRARTLLHTLDELFARNGIERLKNETVAEFVSRGLLLRKDEELEKACHKAVQIFEETMYRGDELDKETVKRLSEELASMFPIDRV